MAVLLASLALSAIRTPAGNGPLRIAATQVLVLQPDGANGTDTFLLSGTPLWNYGNNASLLVGPNLTTGFLARSILSLNVSRLLTNATVEDATLGLYEASGTGGTVQVRSALAPWTEGGGNRAWTRVPVLVRETAGVNRTREPVGITITFPPNAGIDPRRDLRVFSGAAEIPSQVYGYTYSGGQVSSTQVWFDVSLPGHGARWYNVTYAANGTAVPAYRLGTWGSAPSWTFGPTGGGASGATVADLFGDGKLEVVFGGTDGYVYCVNATGGLVWRTQVSPTGQSVPFTPQVADLDRSGRPSIVVVTNDFSVVRLNRTGGIVWRWNSTAALYTTPTLADVNGDGVLDVLVGGNMKYVDAIDGRNGQLLRQYPVGLAGYTAAIANLSGQNLIFFPGDDKKVHAYTFGGTELWANAAVGASSLEGSIALGDLKGDGNLELVTGDVGNNGILFALNATDGTPLWSNATPSYRQGGQTLADLNQDGHLEVLFGTKAGGLYTLDGTNGNTLWSYQSGIPVYSTPAVTDLDGSGTLEFTYILGSTVLVFNAAGSLIHTWSIAPNNQNLRSAFEFPMTTAAVADLGGAGSLEVLVPTGNGMAAFPTGGLFHDWRTWGYNGNHTNLAFDGNSPDRAPFLQTQVGLPTTYPAAGASWNFRDGVTAWTNRGGDFGPAEATANGQVGWMRWNLTSVVQSWVSGTAPNLGLFLTEASETSGTLHAFASGDAGSTALWPTLTITWTLPSGSPPSPRIVGTIPNQSRPENSPAWDLDLSPHAAENGTPLGELRWNVTGYQAAALVVYGLNTPGNDNLTFVPQAGASGDFHVTYWLTDPGGRYASQMAWVNLTPVNLPPMFTPPTILYVQANSTYVFDYGPYISDPDTPPPQLTLASDDPTHAPVSGFKVSFRYPGAYLDQWVFVNLSVSDGTAKVTRAVSIRVTNDQPPYVRARLPDESLLQGTQRSSVFNLNDAFADLENSPITYTAGLSRTTVTIHANGSVDLRAPASWWGAETVTFRATEPSGGFAEDTILVTVVHVDAPPQIGAVPDLRVRFDVPFYFDLGPYLSDPDTPAAELIVTTSDLHVSVSGQLLTIFYPSFYNDTVQHVILTVSDGTFTASGTVRITVGADDPPQVSKLPDARLLEDTTLLSAYHLSQFFTEPNGSLTFSSWGGQNVLVTIHPNSSVDLAASPGWWGVERVTFRATDARGGLQEDSVWVTVLRVDDPPFFLPIPEQQLNATTAYLPLASYLRDPDDALANLSLTGTNSTHATVLGLGLLLHFTQAARAWIQVTVSDGNLTNTTTIVVVVSLQPPSVEEILPAWVYWLAGPSAALTLAAFVGYRRRKLDWAFLVTVDGILVSSVSRREPSEIDTDLVTGMLTTIMDFARRSFSDEKERNLEGLEMGDKRVAIVRGKRAYLAVVYRGRTPGRLLAIMHGLLQKVEREHPDALGEIVDTTRLGDIPWLLERLVSRGNLPFVSFRDDRPPQA